jgi:hypothetical protein
MLAFIKKYTSWILSVLFIVPMLLKLYSKYVQNRANSDLNEFKDKASQLKQKESLALSRSRDAEDRAAELNQIIKNTRNTNKDWHKK